jgi:aspartate/methionine/tyrosine aminotransferase
MTCPDHSTSGPSTAKAAAMIPEVEPFRAIAISRLAHQMKAQGQPVIHMEFGQPSTGAPAQAIAAAQSVLASDAMGYWENPELKAALAARYQRLHGVSVAPERIILTCGASPALVLALLSLFAPGERIAFARPGYVAYRNTVKALHLEPVELDCGATTGFALSAAMIAALEPAPAGLIIASPANPTGTIIAPEALSDIAAVCARRGIRIISDEIYHGLSYGPRTASLLEFAPEAAIVNSFSKYFSMAGWRLGWLVAPEDRLEAARARMGNLFLTAPSLAQHAGLVAMSCEAELDSHVGTYRANRALMLEALPALGLTSIAPPDGAFYIYADIGHLSDDSMDFCTRLLRDTGIATAPGVDFDPVLGQRHMRFSFAVSTEEVRRAIGLMRPWFEAQARAAGRAA